MQDNDTLVILIFQSPRVSDSTSMTTYEVVLPAVLVRPSDSPSSKARHHAPDTRLRSGSVLTTSSCGRFPSTLLPLPITHPTESRVEMYCRLLCTTTTTPVDTLYVHSTKMCRHKRGSAGKNQEDQKTARSYSL